MFAHKRTRTALSEERWDYVVLQVIPRLDRDVPEQLAPQLGEIDSAIRTAGGKTVVYVTWVARQLFSPQNPVSEAWRQLAEKQGALHAPVHRAWGLALARDPGLALYDTDGFHPSPIGSYLAACVIYLVIQGGQASCPTIAVPGVRPQELALLQKAAASAVVPSQPAK